ncbi:MAG TPA: RNA 2',3'-cyclic phosphodiesterase [Blastocatellia bacterium]|nr:RNA 2',3'-cyclic phosphodiesterase [Blastocatellia bacterium]
MRTFICIEIPKAITERIEALQRELRQAGAQVSWTKSTNIHLTLKFLGEVSPSRIAGVQEAVARAATVTGPFDIEVSGSGCFPSARNPRVLWVGLREVPQELKRLQAAIENELAGEGFPREEKKFTPHLTVGRIRSPKNASRVAEELIAKGFPSETFRAHEVILMRSELHPAGSIYTPQAVVPLVENV